MPKPKSERVTDNPFGQKLNSVMRAQGIGGDYRALADVFGVRPQSVYDWVKHGRFAKERFADLVAWSGKSLHCWFDVPELSRPTPAPVLRRGREITAKGCMKQSFTGRRPARKSQKNNSENSKEQEPYPDIFMSGTEEQQKFF